MDEKDVLEMYCRLFLYLVVLLQYCRLKIILYPSI
jgi:hypothetical protein